MLRSKRIMEEIKIQAATWKIYLIAILVIIMVITGFYFLFTDTSLIDKLAGILTIILFGGFVGRAIYSTIVNGRGNIMITPSTLILNLPDCPTIPINWKDIDEFGIYETNGFKFTTIKLNNYNNLLNSLTPENAKIFLSKYRATNKIGKATVAFQLLNFEDVSDLINTLPASKDLKRLTSVLNFSRNKFNGEFLISWNLRDRGADEFAQYLEEKRKMYI